VSQNQAEFPVALMCRVLGVSPSGYYAWRSRGPSLRAQKDALLRPKIRESHEVSRGTYGAPRICEDLKGTELAVGRRRVARLMKEDGLQGVTRRRTTWTTRRDRDARRAPDRVERRFEAERPNQLWIADFTFVPTWVGFLYLAVVMDSCGAPRYVE
jgi:putative transposase